MSFFRKTLQVAAPPPLPSHPYYPLALSLAGYASNDKAVLELLGTFAIGCVVLGSITWFIVGKLSPSIGFWNKMTVLWLILSGTIHLFFEGYFVYNHVEMSSQRHLFAQMWKEYALSDSRYLTSDAFTLCMETITAVLWGPMCYLVAFYVIREHPLRYPLQALVCIGQIYGDILYYATAMFDHYQKNVTYCRPEPYYFWCYYFFLNFIWIVIPGFLLYDSVAMTRDAFAALAKMQKSLQAHKEGNGHVAKPQMNGHAKSG